MGGAGLIFIGVFFVMILIPSIGIGLIGAGLINRLGRFPSKTPAIQTGVLFQLIFVEVVSLTLMLGFFKVLVAE